MHLNSFASAERLGADGKPRGHSKRGEDHGVSVESPVSPELALVCPELRARLLAELPDVDPDAPLVRPATILVSAAPPVQGQAHVVVATLAYVLEALAVFIVWASVTFVAVVLAVLLVTVLSG